MNLNDLSESNLIELENYINNKIGKCQPEIQILFKDLKNGKLKNKNVDSDALDFIYDGLADIVESWINKDKDKKIESTLTIVEYSSELRYLFERSLEFHQEENNKLQDGVVELLSKNNYPQRSKNIKLSGTQKPNEKFIKDGFIYLLRGAEHGQMSGFFAYPYCQYKLNLEEYCKRNPGFTPNVALDRHSQIGKGYFISATTKLPLTTKFCHKVGNKTGSIYILKIRIDEVYRLKAHTIPFIPDFIEQEEFNEEEYVIPDYIMPNELLKEFEYTDYIGVYNYLTEVIGLNITPQDIGFLRNIEQEKDKLIKEGNFNRETEEKIIDDWKKQDYGKVFETIIKEFSKKFDGDER